LHAVTATWTAGVAIAAGIAVGFAMVLQRREVACADGTFFPEGETDFRCFSHPHALVGTAVLAGFVGLGAVLYLAWIVVTAIGARSQPAK
jgi:F0F1-type ATP synthase membrane subunit c/vacuolar-type H+-ATPase subunit K